MAGETRKAGDPYCSNCNYELANLTESSKCPECGKPLVEVLVRHTPNRLKGRRFQSRARLFGMPAIDIAIGPHGDETRGRARGFLAIGDNAKGVVAIGGYARGLVAIGGTAIGGFSMGGLSIGLFGGIGGLVIGGFAFGGMTAGVCARGGVTAGYMADGGMALGYYARGGGPYGVHTFGPASKSQIAADAFDSMSWFFGSLPPGSTSYALVFGGMILAILGIAGILSGIAYLKHIRHESKLV